MPCVATSPICVCHCTSVLVNENSWLTAIHLFAIYVYKDILDDRECMWYVFYQFKLQALYSGISYG